MALIAGRATETFNSDYYIAIVTILPILMVAIEVLTSFNKSIPADRSAEWPFVLYYTVYFLYLSSPLIAASGVIVGVVALMNRNTGGIYQWITFASLVSVLAFLAISSSIYLYNYNIAEGDRQEKEKKAGDI